MGTRRFGYVYEWIHGGLETWMRGYTEVWRRGCLSTRKFGDVDERIYRRLDTWTHWYTGAACPLDESGADSPKTLSCVGCAVTR
jgi:hypothetical protein